MARVPRPSGLSRPRPLPPQTEGRIAGSATFDEALQAGLVGLCDRRPDLLGHAVRASGPGAPLLPLAFLCGEEAIAHADLAGALVVVTPPGTGLTRAVQREERPIWISSIPAGQQFGHARLLEDHGICSGAAFPVMLGTRLAAVIELLCIGRLEREPVTERAAAVVSALLQGAADGLWGEPGSSGSRAPPAAGPTSLSSRLTHPNRPSGRDEEAMRLHPAGSNLRRRPEEVPGSGGQEGR